MRTGGRTQVRRFLGQKVAILDPFGEVRGPARIYRTQYNPLLDIAVGTSAQTRQIKSIAAAIIVPEQGTGAHFSESAETLLAGLSQRRSRATSRRRFSWRP